MHGVMSVLWPGLVQDEGSERFMEKKEARVGNRGGTSGEILLVQPVTRC